MRPDGIQGCSLISLQFRSPVHRHMALAVGGERGAVPPGPSFAALKTGQFGHEIEFGRPGITHEMRDHFCAILADHDALEGDRLADGILNRDLESGGVHIGPGALHTLAIHVL